MKSFQFVFWLRFGAGDYHDYGNMKWSRRLVLSPGTDTERYSPYYEKSRTEEQKQARAALEWN